MTSPTSPAPGAALQPLLPAAIAPPFARYSHGIAVPAGHRLVACSGQLGQGRCALLRRRGDGSSVLMGKDVPGMFGHDSSARTRRAPPPRRCRVRGLL